MAGVDSSIYLQMQAPDILGNVARGLGMRQQIQQGQRAAQEQEWTNQAQKAYGLGVVQNPDGTTSFDQTKVRTGLAALAGQNPVAAKALMDVDQNIYNQNFAKTKYDNSLKQQEIDNQIRRDELASRAADRAEARAERRSLADLGRQEKIQGLQTPFGLANTTDDAKQLKEGYLAKQAFDNKLQQMIDLRIKHGGGAVFNREDVARGKQLSKDLLLEYKNMAKLGVLSKSDEDIINAIIPEDPLEYSSPLAAIQGQDPTLERMKSFKSDSTKNFNDAIKTRTRGG